MLIRKKKFKYAYFSFRTTSKFSVVFQWCQILFRCSPVTVPLILCGSFQLCSILPIHFSPFVLFFSVMWIHPYPLCHASIFCCCFRLHWAIRGKLHQKRENWLSFMLRRNPLSKVFHNPAPEINTFKLHFKRNWMKTIPHSHTHTRIPWMLLHTHCKLSKLN